MCFVRISNVPDNEKEGVGYKVFKTVKNEKNQEVLYSTNCAPFLEQHSPRKRGIWLKANKNTYTSCGKDRLVYTTGWTIFLDKKEAQVVLSMGQYTGYSIYCVKYKKATLKGPVRWFAKYATQCIQADEIRIMEKIS